MITDKQIDILNKVKAYTNSPNENEANVAKEKFASLCKKWGVSEEEFNNIPKPTETKINVTEYDFYDMSFQEFYESVFGSRIPGAESVFGSRIPGAESGYSFFMNPILNVLRKNENIKPDK